MPIVDSHKLLLSSDEIELEEGDDEDEDAGGCSETGRDVGDEFLLLSPP